MVLLKIAICALIMVMTTAIHTIGMMMALQLIRRQEGAQKSRGLMREAHGGNNKIRAPVPMNKRLTGLYHGNGLQPFWIVDGKPGPRAAETLSVLEDAESQGLVPNNYLVDKIHQYWDSKDTTGLVRLDILLTLGMMRYVADQREGRMEPHKVDAKLFATARDVDVDWEYP